MRSRYERRDIFFPGGHDLEMLEICRLLEARGLVPLHSDYDSLGVTG